MLVTIPKVEGKAKYVLKMMIALFNLQGSGDHHIQMGN